MTNTNTRHAHKFTVLLNGERPLAWMCGVKDCRDIWRPGPSTDRYIEAWLPWRPPAEKYRVGDVIEWPGGRYAGERLIIAR
jgi:hypothetical protein